MEMKPAPLKDKLIEFDVGTNCDGFCYKDVAAAVEWLKQQASCPQKDCTCKAWICVGDVDEAFADVCEVKDES
jgi:hypothetical protein|tara:strand:- start:493 stop:711 length:219 start_codon:yes stop_codon:yes gene_type:complete